MSLFLGFDCACKTLAWTLVTFNTNLTEFAAPLLAISKWMRTYHTDDSKITNLRELLALVRAADAILSTFITFHSVGVRDILDGKKVSNCSDIEVTRKLRTFLQRTLSPEQVGAATVVIEKQPMKVGGFDTKVMNTAISYQLMMFYSVDSIPHAQFVSPRFKNNYEFGGKKYNTYLEEYLPKRKTRSAAIYAANKAHSEDMFLHLVSVFGNRRLIADIPARNYPDVAESFLNILGALSLHI